jgi:hypothetical protein
MVPIKAFTLNLRGGIAKPKIFQVFLALIKSGVTNGHEMKGFLKPIESNGKMHNFKIFSKEILECQNNASTITKIVPHVSQML